MARAVGTKPGSSLWLQGLACGALVTMAMPTALLAALLLMPSVVAALFDTAPERQAARPVLLWGLAASVRPMSTLWSGGHTTAHALALAGDPGILATAWAAQAAGWLVAEILPLLIAAALDAASAAQAARLVAIRDRTAAEWDIPAPDG